MANRKLIKTSNSILLLYDMSNYDMIDRLEDYWLPFIQECNPKIPVIVVGTKLDIIRRSQELSNSIGVYRIIKPLIKQFPQIQMGIECSSKDSKNIVETLYCA